MQATAFQDYYESLQLSPTAHPDTIHRIYRILAQRYHPDNNETGDTETFRAITDAYQTLSDPQRRAAYDVQHRDNRRLNWKIFDQSNSTQGIEAERRKRNGILQLLYRKRISQPDLPGMTLKDFEELLGVPKEHLEFSLWFLKENQCVQRTDNGRHSITVKGVELAESMAAERHHETLILPAASNVA